MKGQVLFADQAGCVTILVADADLPLSFKEPMCGRDSAKGTVEASRRGILFASRTAAGSTPVNRMGCEDFNFCV